jgi:hypothetical protein
MLCCDVMLCVSTKSAINRKSEIENLNQSEKREIFKIRTEGVQTTNSRQPHNVLWREFAQEKIMRGKSK